MKKQTKLKTLLLSATLAIILLPMKTTAQYDGFIRSDGNYENRDVSTSIGINTENFGENQSGMSTENFGNAPLTGGFLVLFAAGAVYAIKKRKTNL